MGIPVTTPSIFGEISTNGVYKYFANGEYVNSTSGHLLSVMDPVTGKLFGKTQAVNQQEVDAVIARAWEQYPCWRDKSAVDRAEVLHKAARIMEREADYLAKVLCDEIAKPLKSAREEIIRTAEIFDFTAEDALRLAGETQFADVFAKYKRDKISLNYRAPLGVILAIGPFNYPFNLTGTKIAPALVTGNCCIMKPPSAGAIIALHFGAIMKEAGVPPGVFAVITGRGSEIGDYLVSHKGISMIAFTGSSETGRHIASKAGMIPLLLELGGKDAALVLPDADLNHAADQIVSGAFAYSGQRCTAVKRVLVFEENAEQLVHVITKTVTKLPVGKPRDNVVISALITPQQCDYVQGLIDDALAKGAKLICGNKREGNIMWPTVLDYVTTEMRIAWEEPFGPVLPILRIKSIEEAITVANKSEYGLQSSIFTNDINSAINIAMQLDVGTVQINSKTQRGPDHFPFLGTKSSGLGVQGTRYAIEAMTRVKSIVLNLSEKGKVEQACSLQK
jgi:glyceraldehyde-3-phosphate dehydrogenase (NADP+)